MTPITYSQNQLARFAPTLVAALTLLFSLMSHSSSAQEADNSPGATSDSSFQFISQTSFVPANGDYKLTFSGPDQDSLTSRAEIDVTLYTALEESSSLTTEPQNLFNRLPVQPVASVRNETNDVELTIPVRNSSSGDPNRVLLPDPGVYPVVVEFKVDDVVLQSVRTNLIRLPIGEPNAEGNPQPVQTSDLPAVAVGLDVTQNGYTLAEANQLVTGVEDMPILAVIDQSTIERLQTNDLESRAFLRNADQLQLVVFPGNGADISTLASINQTILHNERLQLLRKEARELGLSVSTDISVISSPLTAAGAKELEATNISTVLYPSQTPPEAESPGVRFGTLPTSAAAINVVPSYSFPAVDEPVELWAHRVAAGLTIDQRQSGGQPTFVYLSPETTGDFGPDQLQILADGDDAAFRVELVNSLTSGLEVLEPAAAPPIDVTQHRGVVELIVSQINTYETTYLDGKQTPRMFRDDLIETFEATRSDQDRTHELDRLRQDLRNEIQTVNLPSGQAVTVAAEMVPVPLTIENNSDGSRQVRLVSDSDKVEIKQDGQVLTIPPGGSSIDLEVEVRSLGVSPVQISLFTPDGKNRLASTRFEVRSTAIPGLGLLLCLLGAVLLAFWWYVHAKRRRNKKNDTQGGDIDDRQAGRRQAPSPAIPAPTDTDSKAEPVTNSANDASGGNLT